VEHIHDGRVHDGRVYSGSLEYTRPSCPYYAGTTVVSVTSAKVKRKKRHYVSNHTFVSKQAYIKSQYIARCV